MWTLDTSAQTDDLHRCVLLHKLNHVFLNATLSILKTIMHTGNISGCYVPVVNKMHVKQPGSPTVPVSHEG